MNSWILVHTRSIKDDMRPLFFVLLIICLGIQCEEIEDTNFDENVTNRTRRDIVEYIRGGKPGRMVTAVALFKDGDQAQRPFCSSPENHQCCFEPFALKYF